jgi:hypothetical protein
MQFDIIVMSNVVKTLQLSGSNTKVYHGISPNKDSTSIHKNSKPCQKCSLIHILQHADTLRESILR